MAQYWSYLRRYVKAGWWVVHHRYLHRPSNKRALLLLLLAIAFFGAVLGVHELQNICIAWAVESVIHHCLIWSLE